MSIEVQLFQNNREFFAFGNEVSSYVHTNKKRLSNEPDETMQPIVEELKLALGIDVEPRMLTSFTIDGTRDEIAHVYSEVRMLAMKHAMLVFWGDSGIIFNFSGEILDVSEVKLIQNSAGMQLWQVTERTLHLAFEDAVRWDNPSVSVIIPNPQNVGDYGRHFIFSLQPDGYYKVVRRDEVWARSLIVDNIDEAIRLCLLWCDQCPAIFDCNWEVTELESQEILHPRDRAQTSEPRDPQAVFRQPAGAAIRRWDAGANSWGHGTDREGSIFVSIRTPFGIGFRKVCDSEDGPMNELVGFENGDAEIDTAQGWMREHPAYGLDTFSVTAMVLPERDRAWADESVVAFHRDVAARENEASFELENFIDEVNQRAGKTLILAEEKIEAKEITTILIPHETQRASIDRLLMIAENHNVSLVVNDHEVVYNPGTPYPGHPKCPIRILHDGSVLRLYWGTETKLVASAMKLVFADFIVQISSPTVVAPADRCSLQLRAVGDGNLIVNLITPTMQYQVNSMTTMVAGNVISAFEKDPALLVDGLNWDVTRDLTNDAETARYSYGDNFGSNREFTQETLDFTSETVLTATGHWVVIHDNLITGDYCQIDQVGERQFVVEWGHDYGEIEHFTATFDTAQGAIDRWVEFTEGDLEKFAQHEWERVLG